MKRQCRPLALFGPGAMSDLSPLWAPKRTSAGARAYGFTPWFQSVSCEENASKCDAQFLISPGEIGRDQKDNGGMFAIYGDFLVIWRTQAVLAELR